MSTLHQKVDFKEIAKKVDQYDFKCKLAIVKANIEIYDKDSDKLITIVPMAVNITNGTMNPAYAKDFFNDLVIDAKPFFVKEALRSEEVDKES